MATSKTDGHHGKRPECGGKPAINSDGIIPGIEALPSGLLRVSGRWCTKESKILHWNHWEILDLMPVQARGSPACDPCFPRDTGAGPGKERLYLAAADHIAEQIQDIQRACIDAPRAQMPAAIAAVHAVLERFALMMVMPETTAWAQFIMRERANPTEAFERI